MKNIAKIFMALALPFLFAGCEDDKADYVRLSNNSFTFSPDGSEVLLVTVEASGKWAATFTSTWLTVEEEDASTLRITATPTRSNGMRQSRITVSAGNAEEVIDLSQLGTNVQFATLDQNSEDYVMSHNGMYIGGIEVRMEGSIYYYTPYVLDTQSGQKKMFPELNKNHIAYAVSNEGMFVIHEFNASSKFYTPDGELHDVKKPQGFSNAIVSNISEDGSIFVGYGRLIEQNRNYPIKWVNNEPVILSAPEEDASGVAVKQGTMARGCSADGSIIYGTIWDDFTPVYWKGDSQWEFVGGERAINRHNIIVDVQGVTVQKTVVDHPILTAEATNMSSSGRYLAVHYQATVAQNRNEVTNVYPALLDTDTGELQILTTLPDGFTRGWGRSVSDNGHFAFACPQALTFIGYVYDVKSGVTRTTSEYIDQEYGFMLRQDEAYIRQFCGSGEAIMGGTYLYGGSYMDFWYMTLLE